MAKTKRSGAAKKRKKTQRSSGTTSDIERVQQRQIIEARRRAMVGEKADTALATCPIDVMLARRIISSEHQKAAAWFMRLYMYRTGRSLAGSIFEKMESGGSENATENELFDIEWLALLERCGFVGRQMDLLVDLVVFQTFPTWLRKLVSNVGRPDREDAERQLTVKALDTLRDTWLEFGKFGDERETMIRSIVEQRRGRLAKAG